MIAVKPFRAVRPVQQYVKDVASYPYDVIDSREARKLVRENAKSFLRVVKSEVDSPDDTADCDEVYEKARENLYAFLSEETLFQDEKECFYIYRQGMGDHVQYGMVGCVSVADYESGVIKRHELTRSDKEADRTRHVDRVNAQTGPIYLTYRASKTIDSMVQEIVAGDPEYDFAADDGITHSVWVVDDDNIIERIRQGFGELNSLYIADGHHRAAAAAAVARMRREENKGHNGKEEYNHIMAVIFPHDQLKVMDYNRVVRDLGSLGEEEFVGKVRERFTVSDNFSLRSPQRQGEFGMYLKGRWYGLKAGEMDLKEDDPVAVLDVSLLQDNLLRPVLSIDDPRTDDRLLFVGGIRGMDELERLVDSGEYAVAFSLYPTTMDQIMQIADQGEVMPPKSTWFEPKLRSGIFVHLLD
ncbi:MAG: DUF1015 domain-containing protein [Syntrophobacterales bacterium]|nr:MAG: DUF1015 domain-containing protein [Syntrophobacterales bacterium]